ncbi:magnesium-translocating P-type ATPase [Streptomyces sp. TP-A0874]|uniref:magnesium-translocating P-type ATPase n=1 Tax=Streptomyces sp. TP-A0874 TaxID=549819 RepID=UPI0008539653
MLWAPESAAEPRTRRTAASGSPARGSRAAEVLPGPGSPEGDAVSELTGLTPLEVLRRLDSGPRGLTESQAEERLVRYGENVLAGQRPVSWPRRFLWSLRDPFTMVLLCLGLVSAAVAAWGTACVTTVLVVVGCVLRCRGEYRADRSMEALRELVATTATVQRRTAPGSAPVPREIPVDQLVPGDVIRLGPGDLVPADVRLLRASGLTVHQAALTGESAPVPKHPLDGPGDPETALFGQPHLCFQGSSVVSGSGTAVVVATGGRTRLAAAHPGRRRQRRDTAFDRSVQGISWILIRFMVVTPPLVLVANAALRGRGLEMLPFAVAVAVALTPEMLPVIVTTTLARGAALLARSREVIVKRLPALHDLGAVDILCVDKTGTLTQDRPVLDRCFDAAGDDAPEVLHWAAVNSLWTLQLADVPTPDALDEAILDAAAAGDSARAHGGDLLEYDGVAALPFAPARRIATAVVGRTDRAGVHTLVVKGAVEDVLERCARLRSGGRDEEMDTAARERLCRTAQREAAGGLRLLAVALAERPACLGSYTPADERGLTFIGFLGLRDATVESAAEALAALARSGVTVKVLTGDHPGTAARVCQELGLDPGPVVTADRLDGLTDTELVELAERGSVFARCGPEHKARVVSALRAGGHTTGFLGDGINDLPALHAADVGICPRDGVDVSREAADIVLAAKDLTAIDHAIATGRRSTGNIVSYLRITLSSNLGNVIAMLAAGLLLPFLPMLPAQVLVQNLCFDAAQLALAYDRPAPAALRAPSRLRPADFVRFITRFGIINAAADLATFAVLVLAVRGAAEPGGEAVFHAGWFTENLLTQALVMLLLRAGRRTAEGRRPSVIGLAAAALAAIGILLPLSPLGASLGLVALPPVYYLLLAVVLALYGVGLAAAKAHYDEHRPERR